MEINVTEVSELFKVIEEQNLSVSEAISVLKTLNPVRDWIEKDGVIYLPPVMSDGTSGANWIPRLESQGHKMNLDTKKILSSPEFKATKSKVYYPIIFKGDMFCDKMRSNKVIRKEAKERRLVTPNAELACLLREKYSDKKIKKMGLNWILVMHKPIKDSLDAPEILCIGFDDDYSGMDMYFGFPDNNWDRDESFAFTIL